LFFESGQARLVRATTEGGSGIRIIHGMSSSDSEEDEDDDDVNFAFRGSKVSSPPGRINRKPECQILLREGEGKNFLTGFDGLMVLFYLDHVQLEQIQEITKVYTLLSYFQQTIPDLLC